ncbi:MAG: hypothetical protein DSY53_01285, partial [Persephonella sp.]
MIDVNINQKIEGNKLDNSSIQPEINVNISEIFKISCPWFTKDFISSDIKSSYFIGRDEELEAIEDMLFNGYPVLFIEGVAGIGKSYLVKKFFPKAYEEKLFDCYGYISLATIEKTDFENLESFKTLLFEEFSSNFNYKPSNPNERPKDKFLNLIHYLKEFAKGKKKLLIIDDIVNIENLYTDFFEKLFNLKDNSFYFLITTREELTAELMDKSFINWIKLKELEEKELKDLFFHICKECNHLKDNREFNKVLEEVLKELDYNTLLTEILAKIVNNYRSGRYRIKEDLRLFAIKNILKRIRERPINEGLAYRGYDKTVLERTFKLFEFLYLTKNEKRLAKKLTVLPPEEIEFEEITRFFIKEFKQPVVDFGILEYKERDIIKKKIGKKRIEEFEDYLDRNLNNLTFKGVLTSNEEVVKYKLHKIVRDYFISSGIEYKDIEFQIGAFSLQLPSNKEKIYSKEKEIRNYLGKIITLERTLRNVKDYEEIKDIEVALFYVKASTVLRNLKVFDIAEEFLIRGGRILERVGYIEIGEGEEIEIKIKEENIRSISEKNLKVIGRYFISLGSLYRERGKGKERGDWEKSIKYFEMAEGIYNRLKDSERDLITIYGNLSRSYKMKGEINKAIKMAEKSLEMSIKKYGEEDKKTIRGYGNIATIYKSKGDYDKALDYQMKGLEINKKAYGEEHVETAKAYGN